MTDLVYTPRMGGIQRGDKRRLNNKERTKIALARDGEKPAPEPKADGKWLRSDVWKPLPGSKSVPLLKLDSHTCRWPVGDLFCGHHTIKGKVYCDFHYTRSVQKNTGETTK